MKRILTTSAIGLATVAVNLVGLVALAVAVTVLAAGNTTIHRVHHRTPVRIAPVPHSCPQLVRSGPQPVSGTSVCSSSKGVLV